ncbi:MAG: type II secretion system F family protein [Bacilli bacterium]
MEAFLLPFVFVYKGVIAILFSPYYVIKYFVKGISSLFVPKKDEQKEKLKVIDEQISKQRSDNLASGAIASPLEKTNPVVRITPAAAGVAPYSFSGLISNTPKVENSKRVQTPEEKAKVQQRTLKQQKEYGILMEKTKKSVEKRVNEQQKLQNEKLRKIKIEEQKQIEKEKKEKLKAFNEEMEEQKEVKKKDVTNSFSYKMKKWWDSLPFNVQKQMELEVKKDILLQQFDKQETSRFEKPLLFEYFAKRPDGILEKNKIEALSRVDVQSFLMTEGYEVYEIFPAKNTINIGIGQFRLKKNKLIFYLTQLSAYLKSGIALAEAVKILEGQAKVMNEKRTWRAVYYDLSMGDVLSLALEKRGDAFPRLLVNMIKTAEMTGNLPETLDDMVDYYNESEKTRKQMLSALMYPAIVFSFATIVITFILMWVVPQFVQIYADMGSDIPAITKFVVGISSFLTNYLVYLILGLTILFLVFFYMFKNIKSFRMSVQSVAMHLPVIGNIIIYNEVTIFTKTFANLINHNVFITDSMDVLSKITANEIYKKLIFDTARNLAKGETISSAFKDHWAFPNIAYQMLITGEKTGRLGPMMERVSEYYQEQHRTIINQMKSLIEPVLIVSLAVVVGGILLSVIIPMYGMYDAL